LLIVGTSIAAAFVATYRMERACAMQLAFQQSECLLRRARSRLGR
jgi:ribulose-5-phosphate 4-epimerase/fuculose-1-phosphate aldolase